MERFAWNHHQQDVHEWTRCCTPYQTSKVHRHNKALIDTDVRFHHVRIELAGPFPHRECTVSSLSVWNGSPDDVKSSLWPTVTPRPPLSPSCKTGFGAPNPLTAAASNLNQRFSSNCVNSWVANASEQPRITQSHCPAKDPQ